METQLTKKKKGKKGSIVIGKKKRPIEGAETNE